MELLDWAKREIEFACKKEREVSNKKEEWDYGCACYESALKAFNSLYEDGHSGFSIKITQSILNHLIDVKPLTPIEDTDDIWNESYRVDDGMDYQCSRMSSLFKHIDSDGNISYSDVDRVVCVYEHDPNNAWSNGFIRSIIDELFPITMPYMPDNKPIVVHCEELLTDSKNGDFDTLGVLYAILPDGTQVYIDRFFKESETNREWGEITMDEYNERIEKHHERIAIESKNKED